ncbi:MAG TPA: hypothetical protein ENK52_03070, partial [Saprospiraceae bacterium]|nr:hypothetical protein [Saprospiraceae bacterium]
MQKSRLIEVLKSFNKKDFRDFRKFVRSPYFNQREDVVVLFDYLAEQLSLTKAKKLSKTVVFNKVFPEEKYNEKKISYTMSFLYNNIKEFLANQEFMMNPLNKQLYLSKALRKRGLNRQFESEIKGAENILEKSELRQMDFHYLDYCVHEEKYNYSISQSRQEAEQFQILTDKLTVFFIANKLRHACASLSHKSLSEVQLKQDLLPEVLKHVETNDYTHLADVSIYYHSYKALTSSTSNANFEQL